jgi:hypothetical protein
MIKKLKIIWVTLLAVFIFLSLGVMPSLAAVTKTSGNLEVTFDEPIFSSSDIWYPGLSLTRDLIVKNKGDETETVIIASQNETETGDISQIFNFKVEEGGSTIYGDSLVNFWNAGEVTLSNLSGDQSKTYKLTASMDSAAGNEYQGKEAIFDLLVGFLGKPTTVTFVSVLSETLVCNDAKPGLPTSFTAVAGPGSGEVSLSWMPPSPPYTYFLVAYSDTSSWPPKWGNPDVGNVTTYTVAGLSTGTYWFWLRAGNGCMPGDFVGPVSVSISGIPGALLVAPGFLPGVLGVKTPGELGEAEATKAGEIAGMETKPICWWWLILSLIELSILLVYYWLVSRQKVQRRYWWILAFLLAILVYVGDRFIAHRYFTPSRFCNLMWLWSILAAVIPTSIYLYFRRK